METLIFESFDDYKNHGKPAGDGDFCVIVKENGVVRRHMLYRNGKWHSINEQPVFQEYDAFGRIEVEMWCKEGLSHREQGLPAEIVYDEHGRKLREYWRIGGSLMLGDCYNAKYYTKDGVLKVWFRDGVCFELHEDGMVSISGYKTNNSVHKHTVNDWLDKSWRMFVDRYELSSEVLVDGIGVLRAIKNGNYEHQVCNDIELDTE